MHGLVSFLDKEHYQRVESLWQMLEDECGLTDVKVTPFPHFSWLIASDFDWSALEATLEELTSNTRPFKVQTTGLGFFTDPIPVIFIPVIRTIELSIFHRQIWERIKSLAIDISQFYAPDRWVPHITLAYSDVTPENSPCAMQKLAFQNYNWEISVDNISFIHESDDHTGQVRYRFELKGDTA
jgi:2'-5' RNA ligase